MKLSSNISNWPAEALYLLRERVNIMELDGDLDPDYARVAAEADARTVWERDAS